MAEGSAQGGEKVEIEFGAKLDEISEAVNKIQKQIEDFAEHSKASLAGLGEAFTGLIDKAVKLGEAFISFEGIKKGVEVTVDLTLENNRLATSLGITAAEASVLREQLDEAFVSTDQYIAANRMLDRQLRNNEEGINRLGVVTRDANGNLLEQKKIFDNAVSTLATYKQGSDQNLVATQLFGRGVADSAKLLKLLGTSAEEAKEQAEKLGLVMTVQNEKDVQEYRHGFQELHSTMEGVWKAIGQNFVPILGELAGDMANMAAAVIPELRFAFNTIATVFWAIYEPAKAVFIGIIALIEMTATAVAMFADIAFKALHGDWAGVKQAWDVGLGQIKDIAMKRGEEITKTMEDSVKRIKGVWDTTEAGKVGVSGDKNAPTKNKGLAEAQANAQLAMQKELLKEAQAMYDNAYANDLISTKEYYAAKLAIEDRGLQDEITAKKRALAGADTQKEQVKLLGELRVLEAQRLALTRQNAAEYEAAERKRTDALEESTIKAREDVVTAGLDVQEKALQQELALRQVSADDAAAVERDLENKRYVAALDGIEARMVLARNDAQKRLDLLFEREKAERDHQQKLTDIDNKAELERQKYSLQMQQSTQDSFSQFVFDMLDGVKTIHDAFKSLFFAILQGFEHIVAQRFAQKLLGEGTAGGALIDKMVKPVVDAVDDIIRVFVGGEAKKTAAAAAGAAEREGIAAGEASTGLLMQVGTIFKSIMNFAAETFAGVFAFLSGFLGPAAAGPAAAASASVAAVAGGLASAAGGWWEIDRDQMARVHSKEMVLPAWGAEGLRSLIENGGAQPSTYNFHVTAVDAAGVKKFFMNHGASIADSLQRQGRNFKPVVKF